MRWIQEGTRLAAVVAHKLIAIRHHSTTPRSFSGHDLRRNSQARACFTAIGGIASRRGPLGPTVRPWPNHFAGASSPRSGGLTAAIPSNASHRSAAIALIEKGSDEFFFLVGEQRVRVVVLTHGGEKYLQSEREKTHPDDLLKVNAAPSEGMVPQPNSRSSAWRRRQGN